MSLFARLMYRALVWKERQRAVRTRRAPVTVDREAVHLDTGEQGETLAYWFLRQAGYIIVARNRRARSGAGEVDLIGWDGPVLVFIEVKTRTTAESGPPEAAVSVGKQRRIVKAAKDFMRRSSAKKVNYRFDIVSVFRDAEAGYKVRLIKDAFKG
jgi:putative endonuclease